MFAAGVTHTPIISYVNLILRIRICLAQKYLTLAGHAVVEYGRAAVLLWPAEHVSAGAACALACPRP